MDAHADEEGEARKGGNVGEDEKLIRRCGYDMVDAAGGNSGRRSEGRGGEAYKAPAEDQGGTQIGREEGQLLQAVGGRA